MQMDALKLGPWDVSFQTLGDGGGKYPARVSPHDWRGRGGGLPLWAALGAAAAVIPDCTIAGEKVEE